MTGLNKITAKDTLIYLSSSKKTLRISKDLSAKQIALLDKYLTNHEIPTNKKIITPIEQHWNEFRNYYGTNKNISNWLSVSANSGDGQTHVACPYINSVSNNWYDMLGNANRNGINEVWLWASGTGNENLVQYFSEQAWELGWLLRQRRYVVVFWQCDLYPCRTYCQWPSESGDGWYVSGFYYTGAEDYIPFNY